MLARLPDDAKTKEIRASEAKAEARQDPEPDDVAAAVEHALFDSSPKRRYVVKMLDEALAASRPRTK